MKPTGRPKTNIRTTKNLDWKTIDVEQTFDESAYAYLAKERITEAFEGGIHKTWNLGDTRKCFDRYQEGSIEPKVIEMEDDYLDSLDFIKDIDNRNIIVEKTQTKKLREGVGASYEFTIKDVKLEGIKISNMEDEYCEFTANIVPKEYEWEAEHYYWHINSKDDGYPGGYPLEFSGTVIGVMDNSYSTIDYTEEDLIKDIARDEYIISVTVGGGWVHTNLSNPVNASGNDIKSCFTTNSYTNVEFTDVTIYCDNFDDINDLIDDAIYGNDEEEFDEDESDEEDSLEESSIPSIEKLIEEKKDNNAFFLVYNREKDKFLSLDEDGGIIWLDKDYAEIFKNRDEACLVLGDDCSNEDIAIVPVTVGDVLLEAVNKKIKENIKVERLNESQEKDIKVGFPIPVSDKGRVGVATAKRLLRFLAEDQMLKAGRTYFVMDSEGNITAWDFAKSMTPGFDYEFSCEVADDDRDWYNCLYINRVAGKLDVKNSEWESYKVQ